jgi:hypothetical protein
VVRVDEDKVEIGAIFANLALNLPRLRISVEEAAVVTEHEIVDA